MSSYTSIRTALYNKLNTLCSTGGKFSKIYQSFDETIEGYPAIMIEPTEYKSTIYTTTDNLREHTFGIVFLQEFQNKTRSQALDNLLPAIDDAIVALEADYRLGGVVHKMEATAGGFGVENGANGAILYLRLDIKCTSEIAV